MRRPGTLRAKGARFNTPVMEMRFDGDRLTTEPRPRWSGQVFGVVSFSAILGPEVVAFPARGFLHKPFVGVVGGGTDAFIVCLDRVQFLLRLEASGFAVDWREFRIPYPP